MPTFTMELWRAIEFNPDIGLNDYLIFDPSYRVGLNAKIIAHYHDREIGSETVDLFRFRMRRRMNEIMPLYNQLYRSERLIVDPLRTIDIRTLTTGETATETSASANSSTSTESKSGSRAVQSTTPQVMLSGDGDYASGAADTNGKSDSTGTAHESTSANVGENSSAESNVNGYQGVPGDLLNAFRRSMMNIDMLIIDELADLFMGVWDNGDDIMPYPFTPMNPLP
jgi:hypothetical protein